ncbi:MAG: transposase [Pseudomonadota bacterium]
MFTGAGRRRRWSAEAKAQIVAESYATSVGEAADRHGLSKTQVFTWRRAAQQAAAVTGFARVEIEGLPGPRACEVGVIEVTLGSACIRIPPGSDTRLAGAVAMALRVGR